MPSPASPGSSSGSPSTPQAFTYEEFHRLLVDDAVSLDTILDRCNGKIPPKQPVAAQSPGPAQASARYRVQSVEGGVAWQVIDHALVTTVSLHNSLGEASAAAWALNSDPRKSSNEYGLRAPRLERYYMEPLPGAGWSVFDRRHSTGRLLVGCYTYEVASSMVSSLNKPGKES
jgi:hypothetical protein